MGAPWTAGRWHWWTSNSWRRLRSDIGGGDSCDVIMPYVSRSDGHPDLTVSAADMALIAAAPDLAEALQKLVMATTAHINAVCGSATAADEVVAHELRLARLALSKARGETA